MTVELHERDDGCGQVVGRCASCAGAVHAGAATIAIGWPPDDPKWETIAPDAARQAPVLRKLVSTSNRIEGGDVAARTEYARLSREYELALTKRPRAGSRLALLLAGELEVLCTACAMRWKHAGAEVPAPGAVPAAAGGDLSASGRAVDAAGRAPDAGFVGGQLFLDEPDDATGAATWALDVDEPRLRAVRKGVSFSGADAELRYRILAYAWQLERPLRIVSVEQDRVRLDELVALALRGGNVAAVIGGAG